MTYQEFRKTYRGGLNKWPDLGALFAYVQDAENVTALHYLNAFDPGWGVWARSERNYTRYTRFGKLPYKNVSISPDGLNRVIRVMTFNA